MNQREREAIMAGLFGGQDASGAQGLGRVAPAADTDPRRRRAGAGSGYGGIAGGEVTMAQMLPFLRGMPQYDYTGAMRGALASLLGPDFGTQGPSARHFQRQGGFDEFARQGPPGLDQGFIQPGALGAGDQFSSLNPIGGMNVAPGNMDNGLALGQLGPPGGMHTQGWRNVAPGYSAAAQMGYGTPGFEQAVRAGGWGPAGQPGGTGVVAPGAAHGMEGGGGGGSAKMVSGSGGGGAQVAPQMAAQLAGMAPRAGTTASRAGSTRPSGGGGGGKYGGWSNNPNNPNAWEQGPAGGETYTNKKYADRFGINYQFGQGTPHFGSETEAEKGNLNNLAQAAQTNKPPKNKPTGGYSAAQETAATKGLQTTQATEPGKTKPAPKPKITKAQLAARAAAGRM